jgi:hypothetical protein
MIFVRRFVSVLLTLLSLGKGGYSSCFVGIPDDCPSGKVCAMYNNKGDSNCFEIQSGPEVVFDLPFDQESPSICTQSGRVTTATHRWRNTLYAIDLATPYSIKEPAIIHAAGAGNVFVHGGCKNPDITNPSKTVTDDCGLGFGNRTGFGILCNACIEIQWIGHVNSSGVDCLRININTVIFVKIAANIPG